MRWSDERYVRVYTRNTGEWILLGWEAQALLVLALRQCDRAGILKTGSNHARGLAAMVGMPVDVVTRALPLLIEGDGPPMVVRGDSLVVRNFIEAQESAQSDAQRARECRARDRDRKMADVTNCDVDVTKCDETVTDGHGPSRTVTTCHSVPSLSVPSCTKNPPLPPVGGKRKKAAPAVGSESFEAFWAAYPAHRRNMGKPAAIAKWPGDEHSEAIMSHLAAAKESHDWQKEGGEFVIGIRRYLNEAAWKTPVVDRKPSAQQTCFGQQQQPRAIYPVLKK